MPEELALPEWIGQLAVQVWDDLWAERNLVIAAVLLGLLIWGMVPRRRRR